MCDFVQIAILKSIDGVSNILRAYRGYGVVYAITLAAADIALAADWSHLSMAPDNKPSVVAAAQTVDWRPAVELDVVGPIVAAHSIVDVIVRAIAMMKPTDTANWRDASSNPLMVALRMEAVLRSSAV